MGACQGKNQDVSPPDPNKMIKAQYQNIDMFQTTIVKNDNLLILAGK